MGIKSKMKNASFKGVTFYTNGEIRTSGGRKIALHDYVGSDKRSIEDLGALKKDFEITAIINDSRGKYQRNMKALLKVLESSGPGVFVHPFLGKFKCALLRPYSISENLTDIGRAEITLNFGEVDDDPKPKKSRKNRFAALVKNLEDKLTDFLTSSFFTSFYENINSAIAMYHNVMNVVNEVRSTVNDINEKFSSFQESLASFRNKINSFIGDVAGAVGSITSLFNNLRAICTNPLSAFGCFKKMFGFSASPKTIFSAVNIFGVTKVNLISDAVPIPKYSGKPDTSIKLYPTSVPSGKPAPVAENKKSYMQPLTAQRAENLKNANAMNIFINIMALGQCYLAASDATYTTKEELDEILKTLEDQYINVIEYIDGDLLDALNDIRNEFRNFAEEQSLVIQRLVDYKVDNLPLVQVCYDLYGNTDNYDLIVELNEITNPANICGTINVLSA